jgi:hypothetical protein
MSILVAGITYLEHVTGNTRLGSNRILVAPSVGMMRLPTRKLRLLIHVGEESDVVFHERCKPGAIDRSIHNSPV